MLLGLLLLRSGVKNLERILLDLADALLDALCCGVFAVDVLTKVLELGTEVLGVLRIDLVTVPGWRALTGWGVSARSSKMRA